MMCKICFDPLDTEHPNSIYGLNPITFRIAWVHYWCCKQAYEELSKDDKDKYDQKDVP